MAFPDIIILLIVDYHAAIGARRQDLCAPLLAYAPGTTCQKTFFKLEREKINDTSPWTIFRSQMHAE